MLRVKSQRLLIGSKCPKCHSENTLDVTSENPLNVQSCKQCNSFNRIEVIDVDRDYRWGCSDCKEWLPDEDSLREHKRGNVHQGRIQLKQLEKEAKILTEREYFVNRALPSYDFTKSGMAYQNLTNPFEVRIGSENSSMPPNFYPGINYQRFGNTT